MATIQGSYQHRQQRLGASVPISLPVIQVPRPPPAKMEPPAPLPERPASALARGVKITEFRDAKVNPEPVQAEESEMLLEEYLSPRKLRDLTGMDDLTNVDHLDMKVDTRDTSLGNFGTHLPNLSQLKLSNSIVSSVRDLGSNLHNMRVLWMARCGVEDLDGLSSMNNLKELYLAYNDVCDISSCSLLEQLQILDLEGNNIDDISQINFLNTCSCLNNLTLEGNPICVTPYPDSISVNYNYKNTVKETLPHLELLDDEPLQAVDHEASSSSKSVSVFDADWALIDELMQEGASEAVEDSDFSVTAGRPTTASMRPSTGYRPGTAYTGTGIRPGTRAGVRGETMPRLGTARRRTGTSRPVTASRPMSARPGSTRPGSAGNRPISSEELEDTFDASDLTRGGVVCGNPSKALKARKKAQPLGLKQNAAKLLAQHRQKSGPPSPVAKAAEEDDHMQDLLQEVHHWKRSYQMKQKEIDDTKTAQVLVIDHDDAVSLSDDESIDSNEEPIDQHLSYLSAEHSLRSNGYSIRAGAAGGESPRQYADIQPRSRRSQRSRALHRYDESIDMPEEDGTVQTPEEDFHISFMHKGVNHRPYHDSAGGSSPKVSTRDSKSERYQAVKPKSRSPEQTSPVIKAPVRSPPDSQKATWSPLFQQSPHSPPVQISPPVSATRIRKGLANVQLLPSKFGK